MFKTHMLKNSSLQEKPPKDDAKLLAQQTADARLADSAHGLNDKIAKSPSTSSLRSLPLRPSLRPRCGDCNEAKSKSFLSKKPHVQSPAPSELCSENLSFIEVEVNGLFSRLKVPFNICIE